MAAGSSPAGPTAINRLWTRIGRWGPAGTHLAVLGLLLLHIGVSLPVDSPSASSLPAPTLRRFKFAPARDAGGCVPARHHAWECVPVLRLHGGRGSDDSADDVDDEEDRSAGDTPEEWAMSDNQSGQEGDAVPLESGQGDEEDDEGGQKRAKGPVLELAGGERMTVSARSLLTEREIGASSEGEGAVRIGSDGSISLHSDEMGSMIEDEVYMCVFVCVCVCVCICVNIPTYIHYVCMCLCMYMYMYVIYMIVVYCTIRLSVRDQP